MSQTGFIAAFKDEVGHFGHGVMFWWLMVAAPLLAMVVLIGLFQDGQMRDLPVAVCDMDQSTLSREFIRQADASSSIKVAVAVSSEDEGLALLRRAKVYGVIILPRHFSSDISKGRPGGLVVYLDGQRMPVGSILRRDLVSLSGSFWRAIYGDALKRNGVPDSAAKSLSAMLSIDLRASGNPALDYRVFLEHGFLPVILSLIYLIYACERIKSCVPPSPGEAMGRAFAAALWMLFMLFVLSVCLRVTGTVSDQCDLYEVLLVYALMIGANAFQALFIASFSENRVLALMMVSGMASPAMAFTGLTFPVSYMSLFARFWASLLPVTHAVTAETALASQGASLVTQWPSLSALIILSSVYGLLGISLCGIRYKKGNAHAA